MSRFEKIVVSITSVGQWINDFQIKFCENGPHPEASSTITSAPLAPAPLGTTPSEPSSSAGAQSSSSIPPLTVCAGSEQGPVKGKPSPQAKIGAGKGPSKSSKGDASPPPFFTVAPQKGKDAAPKGGKKGKNKGKDKGGHKGKGKGKGKDPERLTAPDRHI